jgi:hypothetical protein
MCARAGLAAGARRAHSAHNADRWVVRAYGRALGMQQRRSFALVVAAVVLGAATAVVSASADATTAVHFAKPVKLAGGCGGEPSIDHDASGHIYVSSPKGILAAVASCEGLASGTSGIATWVSNNGGKTFSDKITAGTLNGGGDSDTTVDPTNGDVYVADLEAAAADVCVSHDRGKTYVTAVTGQESCTSPVNLTGQAGPDNDREWVVTYGPTASYPHHDVYLAFHDFTAGVPLVYVSQDGNPFTPLTPPPVADPNFAAAVANGTVVAKPVIDAAGDFYALVTTQGQGNGPLDHLWLVKSTDHGSSWTATSVFDASANNGELGLIFNDLTMDGAGNLYALTLGNTGGSVPPANPYLFRSTDQGATWSAPIRIKTDGNGIVLPALHGGPHAGEVALGWYHSTNTTDPNDETGLWQYQVLLTSNATATKPAFTRATLPGTENDQGYVHQGSICTLGIECTSTPSDPGAGNRNLADFSSVTIDTHGCAVFTYADDGAISADQSNYDASLVNNDVARQTRGCFS